MKLSDYVIEVLKKEGVKCVFGFQGGNISHIFNSLDTTEGIDYFTTYNEQGASFAACGYASINNGFGSAISSSGPGALNMISGISNAYFDSIPCIFITGNVNSHLIQKNKNLRQNAFQETDIVSIVKPITKYAVTVKDPNSIRYHLEKALYIAMQDKKGPVLLDLPHDVQRVDINLEKIDTYSTNNQNISLLDTKINDDIIDKIEKAQRPIIIIGGGANNKETKEYLEQLLKTAPIPVLSSLRGLDILSHNHPCFCGFIGSYGNRYANLAIKYSDVIISIGSRLDERQIQGVAEELEKKIVIQIDVDSHEFSVAFKPKYALHTTAVSFLRSILGIKNEKAKSWLEVINAWKQRYPSIKQENSHINNFLKLISQQSSENSIFCADVGLHQMCAAQSLVLTENHKLLNSSGLGSMGYALPAAIGASLASPSSEIICIVGDGGILMNFQELFTIVREKLPIHIILVNNKKLGMITDLQDNLFNRNYVGTVEEFKELNFEKIIKGIGLPYINIDNTSSYENLQSYLTDKPSLIEVNFDTTPIPQMGKNIFSQVPIFNKNEWIIIEKELEI